MLIVLFCISFVFLPEWVEIKLFHQQARVVYIYTQKLWLRVLWKFVYLLLNTR